ncbi:peroxiredoxin [Halanaerobium hydrogeniformans]|uniref:Peroxiredoxin n=1 Tax=Halanaerobium hydrogeniformans TaxID=656519 RepID=E4RPW8_HALHG|nr:peroxiredoxin [Halanaerobium hydrogeniformans]ADQ14335.1 Peroxiredoxin [Halanaerobium hydrogeniformans]
MEEKKSMPLIGDQFPEFEVTTTKGKINLPEDYKGQWFILFSHPADFTPVCTTEFVAFQRRYDEFQELNTELIGLSIDQVFSHLKWEEWIENNMGDKIEYPIIADGTGRVAREIGLLHTASETATVRAVFIVDPESKIRAILYYPSELGRNMDEIVRMVKGLQKADKENVAIPANWPNNEVVGSNVIVPPANSAKEIELRKKQVESGELESFDWWLCHKKS